MPRKLRELRADLRRAGWGILRQRGSHERWGHPLVPDVRISLAGQDGHDAKAYQERDVSEAVQRALDAQKGP